MVKNPHIDDLLLEFESILNQHLLKNQSKPELLRTLKSNTIKINRLKIKVSMKLIYKESLTICECIKNNPFEFSSWKKITVLTHTEARQKNIPSDQLIYCSCVVVCKNQSNSFSSKEIFFQNLQKKIIQGLSEEISCLKKINNEIVSMLS